MDLVQDNQSTLMAIERCAIRVWQSNKTITDGDMLTVYEKLAGMFERRKKGLPELSVFVTSNQKQLFLDLKELCAGLVEGSEVELERLMELANGIVTTRTVSTHTIIQLLKRLGQSVNTLSNGKSRSDYFKTVEQYLL